MAARTLAQALDIAALRAPQRLALVSPFERTAGVRYLSAYRTRTVSADCRSIVSFSAGQSPFCAT